MVGQAMSRYNMENTFSGWTMKTFVSMVIVFASAIALAAPAPKKSDDDGEHKPTEPPTAEQEQKLVTHFRHIGISFHSHHDAMGYMPKNIEDKDGKPLLSWRVQILPYFELENLYTSFRLDEPWDSEHNKKLIEKIPEVYKPQRGKTDVGHTFVQMFTGKNTLLEAGKQIGFNKIVDGLSNTLMVVESNKSVIWTKPDDMPFDPKKWPFLGNLKADEFLVCMADGAVRWVPRKIDKAILERAITINDGQPFDFASFGRATTRD
jgi:hypothetical protein